MSNTGRSVTRTVPLVLALLLGTLLLLLSSLGAIANVLSSFAGNFNGEAEIVTPRMPFIDSWADIDPKGTEASYAGVMISSPDPLVASRTLQATTAGFESLIMIVGSLLVVLMAASLLRGRGFSRLARWGLAMLGLLIMLSAVLSPQLNALAVDLAVNDLGFRVFDSMLDSVMTETSPESVVLTLWDPIWTLARIDFTALLLGAVISVLGFLVHDGVRLQRDTAGLV
jgi:ABC-type glycerol-3-phosphate transport system permease component